MSDFAVPSVPFIASRRGLQFAFVGAFLLAVTFALVTDQAWEDWYITFRVSKNLAAGAGLVFTPGERVHAFTSPLGTLIPALFYALARGSDGGALWLYRIFSAGLLGLALVLLLQAARAARASALELWLFAGLFAFDARIVDFSVNGMETGLMMVFFAVAFHALTVPSANGWLRLGLAWAGLMWTRPDAFVYIGALAAASFVFGRPLPPARTPGELARLFAKAALVCAAVYLPWLTWTWWYYGSPIPHTITAKGLELALHHWEPLSRLARFPLGIFFGSTSFDDVFMPPYASLGGWPPWMSAVAHGLAVVAGFYWLVPGGRPIGRCASFASLVAHAYLSAFPLYLMPWYVPNVTLLALVALAEGVQDLADRVKRGGGRTWARGVVPAVRLVAGFLVVGSLAMTAAVAREARFQERVIERGNREQVGRWLHAEAAPGDRVFAECLGYIGFYSQLKMLDFPGLASPEVVAARRPPHRDTFGQVIDALRPEWLVLRPREADEVFAFNPKLLMEVYRPARVFDVSDQVSAEPWLPGKGFLEHDQTLLVFRRAQPAPAEGTGQNH